MRQRLKCWLGYHEWKLCRFFALGSRGPSYQCIHCNKVVDHDH